MSDVINGCHYCGADFDDCTITHKNEKAFYIHCGECDQTSKILRSRKREMSLKYHCGGHSPIKPVQDRDYFQMNRSTSPVCENCKQCGAHFIRSIVTRMTNSYLYMHCGVCDTDYKLTRSFEQDRLLKNHYGEPSQIESVMSIEQLYAGDIIAFKRTGYEHHAIVINVDRNWETVDVIEFAADLPLAKGRIKESRKYFNVDIREKSVFVRRYMPLDCLPADDVIELARGFVYYPKSQPRYHAFCSNCQHLASWCKTKKIRSEEGEFYRTVYSAIIKGVKILSLFSSPYIKIPALIISAADIAQSIRSAVVKYGLLKTGMVDDWSDFWEDVFDVAVGIGALAIGAYCLYKIFKSDEKEEDK